MTDLNQFDTGIVSRSFSRHYHMFEEIILCTVFVCRVVPKSEYRCWPYTPCTIPGSSSARSEAETAKLRLGEINLKRPYAIDCDSVSYCFLLDEYHLFVVRIAFDPDSLGDQGCICDLDCLLTSVLGTCV